jgi:hypothetical protein
MLQDIGVQVITLSCSYFRLRLTARTYSDRLKHKRHVLTQHVNSGNL